MATEQWTLRQIQRSFCTGRVVLAPRGLLPDCAPVGTAALLLVLYVSIALGTSFLCSVLEAALLSIRQVELQRRSDEGEAAARRLLVIKRDRIDDAISSILTLNTIAHTVGATLAGAQAAIVFGDPYVGVFSGVLTFLVLILTEIIPKTIGTVYASRLVGFVGLTISLLMKGLGFVLFFTRLITRAFTGGGGHEQRVSRRELAALVSMAQRQGTMKNEVTTALSNLLRFDDIRVSDVMTPRTVLWMLPVEATVDDLLEAEGRGPGLFSRLPLYQGTPDQVEGYVLVREVLSAAVRAEDRKLPLKKHMRPLPAVPEVSTVRHLLEQLLERREQIALVVDEFGGCAGLVTLEDLLETLLGREILDELDTVADLRKLATELRDRRLMERDPDSGEQLAASR